jgi:hypothetical protein
MEHKVNRRQTPGTGSSVSACKSGCTTGKKTGTQPDPTAGNRTIGCGCIQLHTVAGCGCRTFKISDIRPKTGCNQLQPGFYVHTRQELYIFILLMYSFLFQQDGQPRCKRESAIFFKLRFNSHQLIATLFHHFHMLRPHSLHIPWPQTAHVSSRK